MRQGLFDHSTLTVKFGGALSKPHACFTAAAIKVPTYSYKRMERESLGGGWYGGKELVEHTEDNEYIIVHEGVCVGAMSPYRGDNASLKSRLYKCGKQCLQLIKELGIEYKPDRNG